LPTTLLVLSLIGALLTANALLPRDRRSVFAVPSFFAAWPTTELAPQFLFVQVLGAAVLVELGALDDPAGVVALGIAIASWAGLVTIARRALRSGTVVEEALAEGLGPDYAATLGPVADVTAQRALPVIRIALAVPIADRAIEVVRDLRYAPGAGRRHRLDLYRAADEPPERAPVLLQIHGGAWIIGNKRQQARPLINYLAARGWVCIAPNYRLSPRATFPDHLVDVKLALRWVREHVAEYGGDPDFVVVTGGSAGGHLATLVACTANDPEYQPGFEDVDTSVAGCVPFYGVYDLCGRFGGRGADGMGGLVERMVLKRRLADDPLAFSRASPLDRIHADLPPFFVVHGTDDSLVPIVEARAFAARLRAVSTSPVVFLELPGTEHAFEIFHSVRSEAVVRGTHRFLTAIHESRDDGAP
jgi:acetyl esterase/lipase